MTETQWINLGATDDGYQLTALSDGTIEVRIDSVIVYQGPAEDYEWDDSTSLGSKRSVDMERSTDRDQTSNLTPREPCIKSRTYT